MSHVADRILAATVAALAAVPGIVTADIKPVYLLEDADLPAAIIEGVEDEIIERLRGLVIEEARELRFDVFIVAKAGAASFLTTAGNLHEAAALALTGSKSAMTLGGLLTRGMEISRETLDFDRDSIDQPLGGWRISVTCKYTLRSDQPGKTEKEL